MRGTGRDTAAGCTDSNANASDSETNNDLAAYYKTAIDAGDE
jgi:hypothetical protein